jgi:hypothetical protein
MGVRAASSPLNYDIHFQGNIYNLAHLYKEFGDGDDYDVGDPVPIIIYLYEKYGMEYTIQLLKGVYSLILYDYSGSGEIYIYRDFTGIIPLYVIQHENPIIICFSTCSEADIYENWTTVQPYEANILTKFNMEMKVCPKWTMEYQKSIYALPQPFSSTNTNEEDYDKLIFANFINLYVGYEVGIILNTVDDSATLYLIHLIQNYVCSTSIFVSDERAISHLITNMGIQREHIYISADAEPIVEYIKREKPTLRHIIDATGLKELLGTSPPHADFYLQDKEVRENIINLHKRVAHPPPQCHLSFYYPFLYTQYLDYFILNHRYMNLFAARFC